MRVTGIPSRGASTSAASRASTSPLGRQPLARGCGGPFSCLPQTLRSSLPSHTTSTEVSTAAVSDHLPAVLAFCACFLVRFQARFVGTFAWFLSNRCPCHACGILSSNALSLQLLVYYRVVAPSALVASAAVDWRLSFFWAGVPSGQGSSPDRPQASPTSFPVDGACRGKSTRRRCRLA